MGEETKRRVREEFEKLFEDLQNEYPTRDTVESQTEGAAREEREQTKEVESKKRESSLRDLCSLMS